MPFAISENLEKIESSALIKFQKNFGIILSENQFPKQRYALIFNSLKVRHNYVQTFGDFTPDELRSFLFILSQFGDVVENEAPSELMDFQNIPYVLEWRRGCYMVPIEVLDFFANEKIFRMQNYLFALLPLLSVKEKKAWIRWLAEDYEGDSEKELNFTLYQKLRLLQKPMLGKTLLQEKEFPLNKVWKKGENKFLDWFYNGMTTFYYAIQELSKVERDPLIQHIIELIKSGRLVLKKEPEKFRERTNYSLVFTIEGLSIQFRETIFSHEIEKKKPAEYLF